MGESPRVGVTAFGTGGPGTGLWTYLCHVVKALEDQSLFEVDLVAPREILDALPFGSNRVHAIDSRTGSESALRDLLWHNRELPRIARERKWDLLYAPVDRRCPFVSPCPRVTTVHDLSAFRLRGKYGRARGVFNRFVLPRALKRASRMLCDSHATRDDLHRFTSVSPDRSEVVPLGVDAERFSATPSPKDDAVRRHYGLHEPFILYTSRLEHPAKRHSSLVQAFARLVEAGQPHRLVLAGPRWTGAEAIDAEIERLGLGARVLVTGFVPGEHLPPLFRMAEVFAFPSEAEGFGLPVLEAMASGTPVVCRRSPAVAEVAGDAALFWGSDDADELAQLILRATSCPVESARLRAAGAERVAHYRWDTCEKGIVKALARELLLPDPIEVEEKLEVLT